MSIAPEIARSLAAFGDRGAGTDAERRAAVWLADQVATSAGRSAQLETFWCRPNWPLAQAWHVALGLAGSLVSVSSPWVGVGLLAAALVFVVADALFALSPGRRLTPEHASQNVVSPPPGHGEPSPTALIVTANLDAGRRGLANRPALRRLSSRLRAATGGLAPGWAGWLAIALLWALATAVLRATGQHDTAIKVLQLIPTAGLVIAFALLLELSGAAWAAGGAGENSSGVGVAVALVRALDAAPPAHAGVELVITGAGAGQSIGLRRYLRAHRRERRPASTVVLGIGPCAAGPAAWLRSDGPLVPLGYSKVLRRLCAELAAGDPSLGLSERRERGSSPGLGARQAGLPAITLTAATGNPPEEQAMERMLLAGLGLADAIDAYLSEFRDC